jgi:hypothetical protein
MAELQADDRSRFLHDRRPAISPGAIEAEQALGTIRTLLESLEIRQANPSSVISHIAVIAVTALSRMEAAERGE